MRFPRETAARAKVERTKAATAPTVMVAFLALALGVSEPWVIYAALVLIIGWNGWIWWACFRDVEKARGEDIDAMTHD